MASDDVMKSRPIKKAKRRAAGAEVPSLSSHFISEKKEPQLTSLQKNQVTLIAVPSVGRV